jgi:hypothetical protein
MWSYSDDRKADQGQCCKGNPEKTDVWEEMPGETGKHHWNKKPKLKTAATSEEGEDNLQWHQKTEQEIASTSGKQDNIRQDLQKTTELEVAKQTDCGK